MQLHYGLAVDQFVGNLECLLQRHVERCICFGVKGIDFVVGLYLEDALDHEHGHDYAAYAQRICCGISHCQNVAFCRIAHRLLRGCETRRVGYGAAHHAHKLHHGGLGTCSVVYGQYHGHVEGYYAHGKHVEPDTSLFE